MSLAAVRLAMMESFAMISGVEVPQDPLPREIDDKTIIVFPRIGETVAMSKGAVPRSVAVQKSDTIFVEYHRRIPYEHLGSTIGDITTMIDTMTDLCWRENAGGRFNGTVMSVQRVGLVHFGSLGWNEWTFGARLEVGFIHLTSVSA